MSFHAAMMNDGGGRPFGPVDTVIDAGFEAIARSRQINADTIRSHGIGHGQIVKPQTAEFAADRWTIRIDLASLADIAMYAPIAGPLVEFWHALQAATKRASPAFPHGANSPKYFNSAAFLISAAITMSSNKPSDIRFLSIPIVALYRIFPDLVLKRLTPLTPVLLLALMLRFRQFSRRSVILRFDHLLSD